MLFQSGGSEKMRLSGGDLLVGTTDAALFDNTSGSGTMVNSFGRLDITRNDVMAIFNRNTSDGEMINFRKDGATVGSIGTVNSNLYLGTGDTGLYFNASDNTVMPINVTTVAGRDNGVDLGKSDTRFKDLYLSGYAYVNDRVVGANNLVLVTHDSSEKIHMDNSGFIKFETAGSEAARLTSGGSLLVGTTGGATYASTSNEGVEIAPDFIGVARSQNTVMYLNRQGDDGTVVDLRKAGFTRGGLSLIGNDLCIHSTTSDHSGLRFANGAIHPTDHTGAQSDSAQIDLGASSYRFNDIFARNGTIQTSDQNEKQDIESLTEAEKRVAVAAKGLLKKFRWKSAVQDKGDDARIHFGIIAQDLQAAFEAEGLDAGRYGMFTSNTWTEDGVEKTRMGVRYSELLAFIISAI
jgi:hypothetical protein